MGAIVVTMGLWTTANAQAPAAFHPNGSEGMEPAAYEQAKTQFLQQQSSSTQQPEKLQAEHINPLDNFQPTGDPVADAAAYNKLKQKTTAHGVPAEADEYTRLTILERNTAAPGAAILSWYEYSNLPAAKKAVVDAHPADYIIDYTRRTADQQ